MFRAIVTNVMLNAVFNILCFSMRYQSFPGVRTLALVSKTLLELVTLSLSVLWLLFVDLMLYHSRDHLIRRYRYLAVPVLCITAALVLNLFFDIVFSFDGNMIDQPMVFYAVQEAIECMIIVISLVIVMQYRWKNGPLHAFYLWPFLLPFVVVAVISAATPYSFMALGMAVGLWSLALSLKKKVAYTDAKSGFFNSNYLSHVEQLAEKGEYPVGSAIVFAFEGNENDASAILRRELPVGSELMRFDGGEFLMLLGTRDEPLLRLLESNVREATEEFNDEHGDPAKALSVRIAGDVSGQGESPGTFVSRVRASVTKGQS